MAAEKLLPETLGQLWRCVDQGSLTPAEFDLEQERLIEHYREMWTQALMLQGRRDLPESLLRELGAYVGCHDLTEMQRRCKAAHGAAPWYSRAQKTPAQYYDETEAYIYDLIWWHTLWEALTPGGFLFTRFNAVADGERFSGIIRDFRPAIDAIQALGFSKFWEDGWVWGWEVFQKP